MTALRLRVMLTLFTASAVVGCTEDIKPTVVPPGDYKSFKTRALETGSLVLQQDSPVDAMDMYMVGFHPLKEDPLHQMEAHHFCRQINEDFAQCAIFDGNTSNANLNGIEYIISARLFEKLPQEEKQYWHPHNYEILSGQLQAPGIPPVVDIELMQDKINSYGKTWHVWNTSGEKGDKLPYGEPRLAWSFNRDGEVNPELVKARDRAMGIRTSVTREKRTELIERAEPQRGVDVLHGQFPGPTRSIEGVEAQSAR